MFLYFKRREKRGKREAPRLRFLVLRRKTLTVGTALLAAAAIFGAVNAPAAVRASVATRQLPIYCVERDQKVCSISFDAAWGADNTQKILDVLADYGVKATFFVVGNWADQYPEQAKAIVDSGCELMNHSNYGGVSCPPLFPSTDRNGKCQTLIWIFHHYYGRQARFGKNGRKKSRRISKNLCGSWLVVIQFLFS